jgi:hypothetical protein
MEIQGRICEILADRRPDEESSELSKAEAIEALIVRHGWEAVRACMMDVLRDDNQAAHWPVAADFFWGAVLDRRELSADELIALLYYRFDPAGRDENNLVWSIASKLKGFGYLSDYDPLHDLSVMQHLRQIRGQD